MGGISLDTTQVKKGGLSNKIVSVESVEHVLVREEEIMEMNEKELLMPPRKGGISRNDDKTRRMVVQWNDRNGHSLTEVLEFDPSDRSDSDDEDLDSCICTIM